MTHTIREKSKLLTRVRRIRGQVEALERGLENEVGCADMLMLIASVRGAVNALMAEVMETISAVTFSIRRASALAPRVPRN